MTMTPADWREDALMFDGPPPVRRYRPPGPEYEPLDPEDSKELPMPETLVDCGCKTKVYSDGSGVEIYFCALHRAAEDLLRAAKLVIEGAESEGWDRYKGTDEPRTGISQLRAAIDDAENGPDAEVYP